MSAAASEIGSLVSRVRVNVGLKYRRLRNIQGPEGRLNKLRKIVTALIKHERIEVNYNSGDEARQYTERLISEAIRHGDCHIPTMDTADFWLLEKQLVHKLFKVIVPRFENCTLSYTKMYKAPRVYSKIGGEKSILELRGNPYPTLKKDMSNKLLIHNILLDAAKTEYRQEKYAEIAKTITNQTATTEDVKPDQVS